MQAILATTFTWAVTALGALIVCFFKEMNGKILDTILGNFSDGATLIICTHLISDIEKILDEVVFLKEGRVLLHDDADNVRSKYNGSIDEAFREVFKCY